MRPMLYQWLYMWAGNFRQKLLFYSHQSSFPNTSMCSYFLLMWVTAHPMCPSKSFSLSKGQLISHHMTSSFISEGSRTNSIMVGRRASPTPPSNSQHQLGILQFNSILTLPRDRFPRLRAQSYKTTRCFIQIPTESPGYHLCFWSIV